MDTIESIQKKELSILAEFVQHKTNIQLAIVFGSVSKGSAQIDSDLDIALKMTNPMSTTQKLELIETLSLLNGRAIDLIDLHGVGEPLLGQIIKHGILIKGDKTKMAELALKNIYANEDFLPYIKRTLLERREKWIKL